MESKNKDQQVVRNNPKNLQQQISEFLPVVFEFILLILQLFYYVGEVIYRLFKPVEPMSVKEETVLVTGAGHGIGRQLAIKYAGQGATVVLWDINEKGNEETVEMIMKNGGPKPYAYKCDISNRRAVLDVAKKVMEDIGEVTILINNAGIMPTHPFEKHTEQEIRRTMDINLFAHFWTIEAFLPSMKKNNHGHIVALSSIAGIVGVPNLVPYCASKFAVRGLMEALTDELKWNPHNQIKTTTVCPFMVNTGLCKQPFVKFENMLNLLEPEYVAEKIMLAQRTNVRECTIPGFLMKINYLTRLLPAKAADRVKKFFESGVHSDL